MCIIIATAVAVSSFFLLSCISEWNMDTRAGGAAAQLSYFLGFFRALAVGHAIASWTHISRWLQFSILSSPFKKIGIVLPSATSRKLIVAFKIVSHTFDSSLLPSLLSPTLSRRTARRDGVWVWRYDASETESSDSPLLLLLLLLSCLLSPVPSFSSSVAGFPPTTVRSERCRARASRRRPRHPRSSIPFPTGDGTDPIQSVQDRLKIRSRSANWGIVTREGETGNTIQLAKKSYPWSYPILWQTCQVFWAAAC